MADINVQQLIADNPRLDEATPDVLRGFADVIIKLAEEKEKALRKEGGLKAAPVIAGEQLRKIAGLFAKPGEESTFVDSFLERAIALFGKTIGLGYSPEELELVYVPSSSEYTFAGLIDKLHEVRVAKGYKGDTHYQWEPLWKDKADVFGDYGLKDKPQLFVMLRGDGKDNLFFTNTKVSEQIVKAKKLFADKPGTDYLTLAAYVSAQVVRADNSKDGTKGLIDFNDGDWTFTRLPQFSEDGFIETSDGRNVPNVYVNGGGRFKLRGSYVDANSREGFRFAMGE